MSESEIDHGNQFLIAENGGAGIVFVTGCKRIRMSYTLETKVGVIRSVAANKARGAKGKATRITAGETGIPI